MDAETRRYINSEIARQVNIILHGESEPGKDITTETIKNLFPGQDPIADRPIMHPYGFASGAPEGTIQVIARIGEHPGNRMVLGHRAADRPAMAPGEAGIYSLGKYLVRVKAGSITLEKNGVSETMVVGETLAEFLGSLLDEIKNHFHGPPGTPPADAAAFAALKSSFITNGKILAKDGGRF